MRKTKGRMIKMKFTPSSYSYYLNIGPVDYRGFIINSIQRDPLTSVINLSTQELNTKREKILMSKQIDVNNWEHSLKLS